MIPLIPPEPPDEQRSVRTKSGAKADEPNTDPEAQTSPRECSACKSPMRSLGQVSIRVGGLSGGWHLLIGEWADASEGLFPLDVYRCSVCKRVEFYDLDDRLSERGQAQ